MKLAYCKNICKKMELGMRKFKLGDERLNYRIIKFHILKLFIFIITSLNCYGQSSDNCRTLDETYIIIQKTLSQNDISLYNSLIDLTKIDSALTIAGGSGTNKKAIQKNFKEMDKQYLEHCNIEFYILQKNIKSASANFPKIKFKGYEIKNTRISPATKDYTILIKLKINGKKNNMVWYITEFQNCHYIFRPPLSSIFNGW